MPAQPPKPTFDAGHVPMTEEMDSASRSLPPIVPVLIAAVVVAAVVFFVVKGNKPVTPATGAISKLFHVEQSTKDKVLVGVEVHVRNGSEKPIYVHEVEVKLTTDQGEFKDTPAPPSEMPRYTQAYPALKQSTAEPMGMDTKILPGTERDGLFIVGFPVNGDGFEKRKSIEVTISFYDQKPLILKQ